jgi:hypothetical protein
MIRADQEAQGASVARFDAMPGIRRDEGGAAHDRLGLARHKRDGRTVR